MDIKEIRIICSGCKQEYFVPAEMQNFKSLLNLTCRKCNQLLEIRHHSPKEQMVEKMMDIIEKSSYRFLNLPPIKMAQEKMEKENEENNMVD